MSKPFPPLLSLVPYPFLPAVNGGHLGIAEMHRHLALYCEDHVAGTVGNAPTIPEPFALHKIFGQTTSRYLPFRYQQALVRLGESTQVGAVFCEHPYMAISARAVAKALGVPWFLRSHNIESERFRQMGKLWWPVLARYERWAMQHSTGTFFVTAEDARWAQQHWAIPERTCHVAPYGTPLIHTPVPRPEARQRLAQTLGIRTEVSWLYFLGALDYRPNAEAVEYLITEIAPRLAASGNAVEILLAGKGLAPELAARLSGTGITYTGFLPSLDDFLSACDVMLNPVLTGGGIKTKAVEALAWGKRVVSCSSGAAGLDRAVCGEALYVSKDGNWERFVAHILQATQTDAIVPEAFYRFYHWGEVAHGVLQTIFPEAR
ncbi:MAG: glycosyltransferase [Sphingobacteriales bacterium]|nr:MAG: glycosyltransferase [Sphingobacteriales bacterium]